MNGYGFTSALAPQLDAYLTFKQKMGCYGNSRIWYLIRKSSRGRANGTTGLPCVGGESGGGEAIDQAAGSMVTL
jgi:hypothetical protein